MVKGSNLGNHIWLCYFILGMLGWLPGNAHSDVSFIDRVSNRTAYLRRLGQAKQNRGELPH